MLASDAVHLTMNLVSLISADEAPDFNTENQSIFVKDSVEIVEDEGVPTVRRADVRMADYGDMYAYVRCTRIALEAPVYYGDDNAILKKGAGQDFSSSQPGFGRLIVLCAHNNTFFNALKNIENNDIIEIETSYGTYCYEVKETKILNENDKSAFNFAIDHEQLVMYTCYPFDMLAHTPDRFFVYADLVSGPVFVD